MKFPSLPTSLILIVIITATIGMMYHTPTTQSQERERWTNDRVLSDAPEDRHPTFEILHGPSQGDQIEVSLQDSSMYHQSYMNVHLDKVQWDDAFWYVCDGVVIWADSDKDALERCL